MPTTQPLNSYTTASLNGQAYFDCTNTSKLSFGGSVPYTLEAWIKPSALSGTNTIISRFNGGVVAEYGLWTNPDGRLMSYRNVAPWGAISQNPITAGQWYHVATTYDGTTLSLYINGELDSSVAIGSQPAAPQLSTTIGTRMGQGVFTDFFQGEIYEVRVWNVCRSASQILSHMDEIEPSANGLGLVADYDLSDSPVTDLSFNSLPINPQNNPGFVLETAALSLGGADYVSCGADTSLSFGGFAPYTFEGWINLGASATGACGTILSRFNGGVAAEYAFWVNNGALSSYRNVAPWALQSQTVLQPNQWYHVATTYDGATLSLYLNGQLDTSTPFTSQPGFPDLNTLVGASYDHGNVSRFFNGHIQNLRIWKFALSQADIQSVMNEPVSLNPGLPANLDFSVAPISDLAGNITTAPTPGAAIVEMSVPVTDVSQPFPQVARVSKEFLSALQPPKTAPFSDEFLNGLTQHVAGLIPANATQADRDAKMAAFKTMLGGMVAQVRSAPETFGPHVVTERDGDTYHFHYQVDGVRKDTFSISAPNLTPQEQWLFEFILTLVSGFLDLILGVAIGKGAFGIVWGKIVQCAPVMNSISACVAAGATVAAIVGVIDSLYQAGLVKMILRLLLTWWNLVSALWELVKYLAPAYKGYEFGVKVAILAVKLNWMVAHIPPSRAQ